MHFLYIDRGELVRVFQVKERHCTIVTDRREIYMQKFETNVTKVMIYES